MRTTAPDIRRADSIAAPRGRAGAKRVEPARALLACCALAIAAACTRDATLYGEDGLKRASGSRSIVTGREEGRWRSWFPSGERREEGSFDDGRRTGVWTQWYPSGQRRERGARRWNVATHASEREGAWTFWHANGVEAARGVYVRGAREGRWEYTNHDGSLDGDRSGEYHADVKLDGRR